MNHHNIKISNFSNLDAVTYPIIKITGSVQHATSSSCQNQEKSNVYLCLNSNHDFFSTCLINDKFKFLVELQNGKNKIIVKYCCEFFSLILEYFPIISETAVIPLYVICEDHDGCFQAPPWENNTIESACKRITVCSKLLQCVTAEKLYEHGLGRKTFLLTGDCQVFRSQLSCSNARSMSQTKLWQNIGREIMKSSLGCENKKFLAFLSCTKYCGNKYKEGITKSHENLLDITQGYVALGGGGLALFGTACLYTWPETFEEIIPRFEASDLVDRTQFLDDSCYRGTLGACFSTTLGSVLHELLHTFDLGHTEEGIMGRGFDNIYKVFTNIDVSNEHIEAQRPFQDKIEFKEEFEPDSLFERLRKENKKKEFTIIKKFEDTDDTILTKSCAVILCYHRWFNTSITKQSSLLSFDPINKLIKSTAGIRVVEVRSLSKELVLRSWVFDGRILKFSFQVPQDITSLTDNQNYLIFVEDTIGCILKEQVTV
ncbi:uncharacterized protein LOC130900725 [Diorhabda carinulata]|uniref:uncharacterized protein LOC130900725 n=1 Tax=Diorhabda carinulata TaxID=1163345 RepID=UPI0025A2BA29|nr:uncharacterized protein LOC130900725 [Diorhabda carinulata]